MYDTKKIPWPENLFYEIYGPPSESELKLPEDLDGSIEYVIRTFLDDNEEAIIRERFEEHMTIAAIAQHHGLTIYEVRGIIHRVTKRFRFSSKRRFLVKGVQGATTHYEQFMKTEGYKEGYIAGYDACKNEQSLEENPNAIIKGSVEFEHIEDIPAWRYHLERTKVNELNLRLRSLSCLSWGSIEYVGQLIRMTDADLLKLRNLGPETLRDIREKQKSFVQSFLKEYNLSENNL